MFSVNQTASQVLTLLETLPGIDVLKQDINEKIATFAIRSHDAASARSLQSLCQGANAALDPPLLLRDPDFNTDKPRQFSLSASFESFERIRHGNLQLLGIHLAWHLHAIGLLSQVSANELLYHWNGQTVGG